MLLLDRTQSGAIIRVRVDLVDSDGSEGVLLIPKAPALLEPYHNII